MFENIRVPYLLNEKLIEEKIQQSKEPCFSFVDPKTKKPMLESYDTVEFVSTYGLFLKHRLILAWNVFIGKYDAFTGEK